MKQIEMWEEDGETLIHHPEHNVTTQGDNEVEALLMLADAINERGRVEMMKTASEIFVLDEETESFIRREFEG
jgi:hypothetical protein